MEIAEKSNQVEGGHPMRPALFRFGCIVAAMTATTMTVSMSVQGAGEIPIVSARTYVSGAATIKVTGAFAVNQAIPINAQASFSDGEMTWLQYGVSGSEAPNALVTISAFEVGVSVSRGKQIVTAGGDDCTGKMAVTSKSVTATYKCVDVTSYDPGTSRMAKADIEIVLNAES